MENSLPVLVIVGPTASGKTELSLLLSERLSLEIISADSRQVYKRLDIGTAKPPPEQRQRVPHHFIDFLDLNQDYSAGEFGREARVVVEHVRRRGAVPIVVGGSGLYVKALLDGLFEGPGKDPEVRAILESRLHNEGSEALLEQLRHVDPETAERMDVTKPRRIVRALEVYYLTGKPLSHFHREQERTAPFEFVQIGLLWDRRQLYERIEQRVERMMRDGFLNEVQGLRDDGYDMHINALNTVGYKEMFDYLRGQLSLDDAVKLMKQNSRRFAKRQMTWFRADTRIRWVAMQEGAVTKRTVERVLELWQLPKA